MTMHDEDPVAPPECETIEQASAELAQHLVQSLTALGYDFALVSLRKRVNGPSGLTFAPGAIAHRFHPLIGPVLRQEAKDLRRAADELERYANDHDMPDVLGGYVQQVPG